MPSSVQIRNDEMVGILSADFVNRNDPVFTYTVLDADANYGATEITVVNPIPSSKGDDFWVVIDPFTDDCEVRKVTSIASGGLTFTLGSALIRNHSRYTPVWYIYKPIINVAWFDIKTDPTTAFINAFAQVKENECGLVYIPPGEYLIDSTITVYSNTHVFADYYTATVKMNFGNDQLFYLGIDGRENITFEGLILDGNNMTGGIAMRGHNVSYMTVKNCRFVNFNGGGIRLRAPDNIIQHHITIKDCEFSECGQYPATEVNAGVYISGYYYLVKIIDCDFWNCYYMGIHFETEPGTDATTTTPSYIEIIGNTIRDNFASTLPTAALVAPWSAILVRGIYADGSDPEKVIGDVVIDSNICRGGFDTISVGWTMRCVISNNVVRENGYPTGSSYIGGDGIVIFGQASWCQIVGNSLYYIAGNGIHLQAGGGPSGTTAGSTDHNAVIGNTVFQYNRGNYVNAGGIALLNMYNTACTCDYNVVMGNCCAATGVTEGYGIAEQTLSSVWPNRNVIIGNEVSVNPKGGMYRSGANDLTVHNRGYDTEKSGTVTLPAGNTSVTVTHGLDRTPAVSEIIIRPQSDGGPLKPDTYWVDNVTSTQFTINVDIAPAWNMIFSWNVHIIK